ncbi:MAG: serine/threonine protein kinase, partial [Planctomycetales bacterium]|nr:serine/threonine protein kinase [Planctomycetales bacterium]
MPAADDIFSDDCPSESARRIDAVCDRFETSWRTGERLKIEPLLNEVPESDRWLLLRELLILDIDYRLRKHADASISLSEYELRFPQFRRQVAEVCQPLLGLPSTEKLRDPIEAAGTTVRKFRIGDREVSSLREYELLDEIGSGGMGKVFRARHRLLGRIVAIKVPNESETVARFRREMECIGTLDHPNITNAYDANLEDIPYLVMEFVDGLDLRQLVETLGRLSVPDACELIRQAAVGLQHALEHKLVHRDIKPSNLLLSTAGVVKILDLGLARLENPAESQREDLTGNNFLGTAQYMAPEQALDSSAVDIRSDLYSLGCTLFYLLTGEPPYTGRVSAVLVAHQQSPIPSIHLQRASVPEGLVWVIERLLAKSREDRPATPADVALMLSPFTSGSDLVALASLARSQSELGRMGGLSATAPDTPTFIPVGSPLDAACDSRRGNAEQPSTEHPEVVRDGAHDWGPTTEPLSMPSRFATRRTAMVAGAGFTLLILIVLGVMMWDRWDGRIVLGPTTTSHSGGWQFTNGSVTSPKSATAWLRLPEFSSPEFELHLTAELLDGQRLLLVHVSEETPLTVLFRSHIEVIGQTPENLKPDPDSLGLLNGLWGDWNEGKPRRLILNVSLNHVRLVVNGRVNVDRDENLAKFSAYP